MTDHNKDLLCSRCETLKEKIKSEREFCIHVQFPRKNDRINKLKETETREIKLIEIRQSQLAGYGT